MRLCFHIKNYAAAVLSLGIAASLVLRCSFLPLHQQTNLSIAAQQPSVQAH